MQHTGRVRTLWVAVGCFVVGLVLLGTACVQKPEDIEAEIRKAQKDSSTVLVVIDVKDKYHAFPVSGIAEVVKNKVTLKAGTYTIHDATGDYSPREMAEVLINTWKAPPSRADFWMTVDKNLKKASGDIGTLKQDLTLEVKKILLSAKQK